MPFQKFPFKIEKQFRLPGFDYSQNGYYFVTICVKNRLKILGSVGTDLCVRSFSKNVVNLSDFGQICNKYWLDIPNKFYNVLLDQYIIMPDHIHGIIIIKNTNNNLSKNAQTHRSVPTKNPNTYFGNVGELGQIIRWFKTMTTNEYIKQTKQNNLPKFQCHVWQPRFHDRIIRTENEYFATKQYIIDNPKNF